MELFGVALVVLLVGITLVVLTRSAADGRTWRKRVERGSTPVSDADRSTR